MLELCLSRHELNFFPFLIKKEATGGHKKVWSLTEKSALLLILWTKYSSAHDCTLCVPHIMSDL